MSCHANRIFITIGVFPVELLACQVGICEYATNFSVLTQKHFIHHVHQCSALQIDHFTVVSLVAWPLNGSEARVDLVLIQTSLLLLCKSSCSYAN